MIAYRKLNGLAQDIRFVADDYKAALGEILVVGDVLPTQASLSDPQPPALDVAGFINDAKAALGGVVAASKIIGAQAVFLALQSGNLADAEALIVDSHGQAPLGGLTDAQYAGIKQLAAKHNVPLILP